MKTAKTITVSEWIKRVGARQALINLLDAGLSPSMADKLAHNRYGKRQFQDDKLNSIKRAMAIDGYSLADESRSKAG